MSGNDIGPGMDGKGEAAAIPDANPIPAGDAAPRFPVVGVGASAGGLAAFSQLLTGLPAATGMAFVLIQHLDPCHDSELARLLAKDTAMPVAEAAEGMVLAPDHVYVIPPNTVMVVSDGRLRLSPRETIRGPHLTIDHFFRALAASCESRAIGVLLSGTGTDGTLGLAEIKAVGGITFAQDPRSAEQAEMPRSAIAYGCVDLVLSVPEIAQEITTLGRHRYLRETQVASDRDPFADEAAAYGQVLAMLTATGGVDFTQYRPTTIKRRILRRMASRSCTTLGAYLLALIDSAVEVDLLLKDVLINVTNFFRDGPMFLALTTKIFPELVKNRGAENPIRLWVVGCSTGQEAYSLAIALIEFLDHHPAHPTIQIFATDISEPSLATARLGVYPESIQGEVPPERLRRHFTRVTEGYRINKSIRDLCVFAKHDATADTPFSKIDLLSCRNMLIYLAPAMQMRMIAIFHYALNIPGYMILGNSESTGRSSELFTAIEAKQRLYLKNRHAGRIHPPTFPAVAARTTEAIGPKSGGGGLASPLADYQRAADRLVIGRYAPAGVLIDPESTIIQFRGDEASLNLLKMVPYALAQALKEAISEARAKNASVDLLGVRFRNRDVISELDVHIFPIRPRGQPDGCMLVLFEPRTVGAEVVERPPQPPVVSEPSGEAALRRELAAVRQELANANDYLKSLTEENGVVTDELKLANNEANSSNEELRCTNEELQTAKEEVLSANEELVTLNEELRSRNLDLTMFSNDLTNLLDSIDLPVLMLGGDMRLRREDVQAGQHRHRATAGRTQPGLRQRGDHGIGRHGHPHPDRAGPRGARGAWPVVYGAHQSLPRRGQPHQRRGDHPDRHRRAEGDPGEPAQERRVFPCDHRDGARSAGGARPGPGDQHRQPRVLPPVRAARGCGAGQTHLPPEPGPMGHPGIEAAARRHPEDRVVVRQFLDHPRIPRRRPAQRPAQRARARERREAVADDRAGDLRHHRAAARL
jgi:two-component system CheB/CheR fusion protein